MQVHHDTSSSDASALAFDDGENITLQVSSRRIDEPTTEKLSMTSTNSGAESSGRTTASRTNRPWARQGKGVVFDDPSYKPIHHLEMVKTASIDAAGEQDSFSEHEESVMSDETADSDDDVKSIISVSSSPDVPKDAPFGMSERPWKIESFTRTMRQHWEAMYSTIQKTPLANDWDATEAYQKEKDREMLMYIEDFPLAKWVIPRQQAEMAYSELIERIRWRSLGIVIYDRARIARLTFPHTINPGIPTAREGVSYKRQSSTGPLELQSNHVTGQQAQHQMHESSSYAYQNSQIPLPVMHSQVSSDLSAHNPQTYAAAPPTALQQRDMQQPPSYDYLNPASHSAPKLPRFKLHGPKPRSAKKEKKPLAASIPTQPPPAPPYVPRHRPTERKLLKSKSKVRQNRKQAEAEIYPWHRQFDFVEAKETAFWDDSLYDPEVLSQMARTRKDNRPIILVLDDEQSGKQRNNPSIEGPREVRKTDLRIGIIRQHKAGKYTATELNNVSDGEKGGRGGGQSRKSAAGSESFHPGNFSFATDDDARRASMTKYETPDEIIAAAEAGKVDWALCKQIMICWNPGKKGATEQLIQSSFRIYDTLITRTQFAETKILTRRAAECIIDFCPDLLWRETLLRIVSEGGLGNKDVRDRFCLNGCYADKATITKRIAAALGQKQAPPKPKDGPSGKNEKKEGREKFAEENYYASNGADFDKYIRFFGKRQSTRNQARLAGLPSGAKRNGSEADSFQDGAESKRLKLERSDVCMGDDTAGDVDTIVNTGLDDEAESAADSPQDTEDPDIVMAT